MSLSNAICKLDKERQLISFPLCLNNNLDNKGMSSCIFFGMLHSKYRHLWTIDSYYAGRTIKEMATLWSSLSVTSSSSFPNWPWERRPVKIVIDGFIGTSDIVQSTSEKLHITQKGTHFSDQKREKKSLNFLFFLPVYKSGPKTETHSHPYWYSR